MALVLPSLPGLVQRVREVAKKRYGRKLVPAAVICTGAALLACRLRNSRMQKGACKEFESQALKFADEKELTLPESNSGASSTVGRCFIWDTLRGPGKIEAVRMWMCAQDSAHANLQEDERSGFTKLRMLLQLGNELCGHPEFVHGGFMSALLDDQFGWATFIEKDRQNLGKDAKIFTANLNVNYRKPVSKNAVYMSVCEVQKVVREKKVYLQATVYDEVGDTVFEGTALYIVKR